MGPAGGYGALVGGGGWGDALGWRGELAGLPEFGEGFQAGEDAGEESDDEGVQGIGQPERGLVRCRGGAELGELGCQRRGMQ